MAWEELKWDTSKGVKVARLCGNSERGHADHWARVVILDLSAEEFEEFDDNPVKFARDHELYPEQPILWMPDCAKPPFGKGIPKAAPNTRWTVLINHGPKSAATGAAIPRTFL
jgi:hypothetical protein